MIVERVCFHLFASGVATSSSEVMVLVCFALMLDIGKAICPPVFVKETTRTFSFDFLMVVAVIVGDIQSICSCFDQLHCIHS